MLTQNEQKVLSLIEQNPFRSQQEIASLMGISRSTVATIISALMAKRQLLGRAYILNQRPHVVCIGGLNIDRKYRIQGQMQLSTSNPVTSAISVGGVARNVAENLGRLDVQVQLLSVAGRDQDFEWIKQQTEPYVDLGQVSQFSNAVTSTYSAILDQAGDMQLALADMAVADLMTRSWIEGFETLLRQAAYIVMDLNVPLETAEYLISLARNEQIPLAVVPVSAPKMAHLPRDLRGVSCLVVNQDESEAYFDCAVGVDVAYEELVNRWLETGVEQVVLTRGTQPVLYGHQSGVKQKYQPLTAPMVVDVTGAGDSFTAGLVYGLLQQETVETAIGYALTNSYFTVQSEYTVRRELTAEGLSEEYKQLQKRGL